ncbi:MAG TPA: aminotransferase class I/II-fold pyridoxal phosphate-dependent enzyme [Candidatus Aquilonibacter sp.]|nr:aminotransferase class I/II-fold pyridoxal phosphate-dependent enzyme [Candidatus Aquilonibacter sp.]
MTPAVKPSAPPAISSAMANIHEAISIKFNNRVYELQAQGIDVTVLSLGEAFFDLPAVDVSTVPFPQSFHYSHSRGIVELREKIAEYYARKYRFSVDPRSEMLVTAGSKAAIYMAFAVALAPGDEVLIPEPAWVSYSEQVKLCGGVPVGIPLGIPISEYDRFVSAKTRVLVVNTPHNPTGYRYSDAEGEALVGFAMANGLWLFSDEAYSDFTPGGYFRSLGSFDSAHENVIVFNSVSKNYGISGWRIGYAMGRADFIDALLKVNQHLITCPATILQYYISRNFDGILDVTLPQIAALIEKRAIVARYMSEIGLSAIDGDSTFYFFVSIAPSSLPSDEFCIRLLDDHHIAAVPGIGYGASCDSYIRISIGTESMDRIAHGLRAIKSLVNSTASAAVG